MNNTQSTNHTIAIFRVLPQTGIQICRNVPIFCPNGFTVQEFWNKVIQYAQFNKFQHDAILDLVSGNAGCLKPNYVNGKKFSRWMRCASEVPAFFRLQLNYCEKNSNLFIDFLIDTNCQAVVMPRNTIPCVIEYFSFFLRKKCIVGEFFVLPVDEAQAVPGSLVLDYGNTATTAIYSTLDHQEDLLNIRNPWDPQDSLPRDEQDSLSKDEQDSLSEDEQDSLSEDEQDSLSEDEQDSLFEDEQDTFSGEQKSKRSSGKKILTKGRTTSQQEILHSNQLLLQIDFISTYQNTSLTYSNTASSSEEKDQVTGSNSRRTPDVKHSSRKNKVGAYSDLSNVTWFVTGERAKELVRNNPGVTYLFSPKKYMHYWPSHLENQQPRFSMLGLAGQRRELYSALSVIKEGLRNYLQMIAASLANPNYAMLSPARRMYLDRIMLTYPLTWRQCDKDLFHDLVEEAAREVYGKHLRDPQKFVVEYICSEPVAIVAYQVWELFYTYTAQQWRIVKTLLGNVENEDKIRVLVVDIGGGSTDIALVDVQLKYEAPDDITIFFQMADSMRFNRAGDRISHVLATWIWTFIQNKYNFHESLAIEEQCVRYNNFDRGTKHELAREIMRLTDEAKIQLSQGLDWTLSYADESSIFVDTFHNIGAPTTPQPQSLVITHDELKEVLLMDYRSKVSVPPGFMDIFLYLKSFRNSLIERKEPLPHCVLLSGRTSKFPFIKDLAVEALDMPSFKVSSMDQFMPPSLKHSKSADIGKTAVVLGAQRFRFGTNIKFRTVESKSIFNHYIGTYVEAAVGAHINFPFVKPGDSCPCTFKLDIPAKGTTSIAHSINAKGIPEVLAMITNNDDQPQTVTIDAKDDFTLVMYPNDKIVFTEQIPGGTADSMDNFCDTGKIDMERGSIGFIRSIIKNVQSRHHN